MINIPCDNSWWANLYMKQAIRSVCFISKLNNCQLTKYVIVMSIVINFANDMENSFLTIIASYVYDFGYWTLRKVSGIGYLFSCSVYNIIWISLLPEIFRWDKKYFWFQIMENNMFDLTKNTTHTISTGCYQSKRQ